MHHHPVHSQSRTDKIFGLWTNVKMSAKKCVKRDKPKLIVNWIVQGCNRRSTPVHLLHEKQDQEYIFKILNHKPYVSSPYCMAAIHRCIAEQDIGHSTTVKWIYPKKLALQNFMSKGIFDPYQVFGFFRHSCCRCIVFLWRFQNKPTCTEDYGNPVHSRLFTF